MSSWVAPAVAAEMWGRTVEQILAGVADGSIPSMVDGEFLFVNVASAGFARSTPRQPAPEPLVTSEELLALTGDADPEGQEELDDSARRDVSQWRAARQQSARLRRPPVLSGF